MSAPSRMCVHIQQRLVDDRRAGRPISPDAERHLETCTACTQAAARLDGMIDGQREVIATDILTDDVADRVLARLQRTIDEAVRPPVGWRARWDRHSWATWPAWSLAAAVAGIVAVVSAGIVWRDTGGHPTFVRVLKSQGEVAVRSSSSSRRGLIDGMRLNPRDAIDTGPTGHVVLQLAIGRLALGRSSAMRLDRIAPHAVHLGLDRGAIAVHVPKENGTPKDLRVDTSRAQVRVVGTLFGVTSDANSTTIAVDDGLVDVALPDGTHLGVPTGESLTIRDSGPLRRSLSMSERETLRRQVEGDWSLAPQITAAPVLATPEADARTSADEQPARRLRADKLRRPERPATATAEELAREGKCQEASALAHRATARDVERNARDLLASADCYYVSGDKATALRHYREVSRRYADTGAGRNATYEYGRLAMQQGDHREAATALRRYLAKSPNGPLAPEASFRLCVLAITTQRASEAVRCLRDHRARFGHSEHVTETYFLEATVERTLKHDCAAAVVAYDAYLTRGGGESSEQATQWRAWCHKQLAP